MKATEFEYRHQTLVHQALVAAAFLTYLIDRDDVVWRFVKGSAAPRELERSLFVVATVLIAFGAAICTWARVYRQPRHLGDLSFALGLGSLAPLSGFVILVLGEVFRVLRLILLHNDHTQNVQQGPVAVAPLLAHPVAKELDSGWGQAFRREAVKWGLLLTMIVFVITLKDRVAEVLAASSLLVGVLLNPPTFMDRRRSDQAG